MRFVLPVLAVLALSGSPAGAQTPDAARAACLAAPVPACLTELALSAARDEPEGWAMSATFEAFIKAAPTPEERESWMNRYAAWAQGAQVDGIKERLASVRAEFLSVRGDFDAAYRELGLDKAVPDAFADPSALILDEARAGRVTEALARINALLPDDSRDGVRQQMLDIVALKSPSALPALAEAMSGAGPKLYAKAFLAGFAGDTTFFSGPLAEALKTKRAPFDMPDTATREAGSQFLLGAYYGNALAAFETGLKTRPRLSTPEDLDTAGRLATLLVRDRRSAWIAPLLAAFSFTKEDELDLADASSGWRLLPPDELVTLARAFSGNAVAAAPVTDAAVEALAGRGAVNEARALFVDGGRMKALAQGAYGEERVSTVFETLSRALLARAPKEEFASFAASAPAGGAKAYLTRIQTLYARLPALDALKDEPSEEDWGILMEFALASGDPKVIAATADRIRDPGLRASALVQAVTALWEKK